LAGEGVSGAEQTAFGASSLFGSAIQAQALFWNGGQAPNAPPQEVYRPLKLGPSEGDSDVIVRGGFDGYVPRTWRLWATGFGGTSSLDGDGGTSDLNTHTGGVAAGLDYRIDPTALVGIAGGYTNSGFSVDQLRTSGTVNGAHAGLYGVKWFGLVYLEGDAEYAHFDNQTNRFIDWVLDERAWGSFSSDALSGHVESGWQQTFGVSNVTPFVGLQAANLWTNGFTERSRGSNGGAGLLGLTFDSSSVASLESTLGVQFDTHVALSYGRTLVPFVRVAWLHEFDPERGFDSFLTQSPKAAFSGRGASAVSDAAKVDAGLRLDLTDRIGVYGFFEGEFASRGQSNAGFGGLDGQSSGPASGSVYGGHVGMKVRW
jgi:outer membrane autotransporter protein